MSINPTRKALNEARKQLLERVGRPPGNCLAFIPAGGRTMRSRVLGAATFFLSLQLLAAASAHAQGLQPSTPPKARPPGSSIAHNFVTWFHHITGAGGHRHRIVSSPPLPRPRPPQFTQTPAELSAAAVEQNKTPAVEPNEVQPAAGTVESPAPASSVEQGEAPAVELNEPQPAATAAEPNKVSAAPDTTVEPDKPPMVELNEVQAAPAAVEPSKVSPPLGTTVEPHKAPAELQTKAPGTPTGTVLRRANIQTERLRRG